MRSASPDLKLACHFSRLLADDESAAIAVVVEERPQTKEEAQTSDRSREAASVGEGRWDECSAVLSFLHFTHGGVGYNWKSKSLP